MQGSWSVVEPSCLHSEHITQFLHRMRGFPKVSVWETQERSCYYSEMIGCIQKKSRQDRVPTLVTDPFPWALQQGQQCLG